MNPPSQPGWGGGLRKGRTIVKQGKFHYSNELILVIITGQIALIEMIITGLLALIEVIITGLIALI